MGFLSDIGGMLPTAYAGFNKGVDDMKARQQRDADLQYQEEQRTRARSMAPIEDEAKVSRLKTMIDQDKTAGIKGGIERQLLGAQQDALPQQLTDARIAQELSSAKTASDATNSLLAMGGQAAAYGDTTGLNNVFGHLIRSGLIQSTDGQKLEPPVNSTIINAPKGSVDFVGQPIDGRAIQATMPDGSKHLITPRFMEDAYKRQLQTADAAGAKIIKPGEEWRTPSGRLLAEGKEKVYPGGVVEDANGDFVRIPGVGGTGAGSRSGAGGKAPASPQSAAVGFFATAAEKAETKLAPTQIAYGQRLAEQIATQRSESGQPIPPAIAAEVAMEVALDPAKIQPQVNVQTGKIEGVFSRRDLGDVVVEPWSPALQRSFTPEQLTKAAEELIKAQPEAVRTEFVAAAHDPAARKALLDKVTQEIAAKVPAEQVQAYTQSTLASLSDKLDIVAKNTKPPQAKTDTSIRSRFGIGGMSVPIDYTPLPGTPPEVAERMLARGKAAAEESARKSAAETEKREKESAAEAEGKKSVAHVTSGFVKSLTGTEARKLRNGTGWKYLDSDMRKLLTLQAGRSD